MLYLTQKNSGWAIGVDPLEIEALQVIESEGANPTQVHLKSGKSFTVNEPPALIAEARAVLASHMQASGGVIEGGDLITGITVSAEGHTLVTYRQGKHLRGGVTE